MSNGSAIGGSIDSKAFPFLLMDLHRNGATGSLKVEGPSYQKALYFRSGRVLFGSSNDPRDQLGAILIESGRITPEQLEDVNTKVGPGSPLAKVLAESGIVSQRELGEAARAKVERILSDIISYEAGSFEFEDGVLPKGAVDLKLSTEKLVLNAVRRISDRNFVLRYLDSLEVVLQPLEDLGSALAEATAEAGGLPERLDGQRSLKQAAALAGLDEFDAGKIACGLLFLGLLDRATELSGSEDAEQGFIAPEPAGSELDLGQTARFAFDTSPEDNPEADAALFNPEPAPAPPPPEAEPEPEPARMEPEAPEAAAAAPASWTPPSAPMPDYSVPAPTPPQAPAADPFAEPEEAPSPRGGRPSPADLEALDTLLGARETEGPLEPLDKPAHRGWEPQFGIQPARRARLRSGPSPVLIGAIVVVVLAALGGGGYYYLYLRPGARVAAVVPPPTTAAAPSTQAPAPPGAAQPAATDPTASGGAQTPGSLPASSAPATSPPAGSPTTMSAAATSPPATAPPKPAPPSPAAGGTQPKALESARAALESGRLAEAARAFKQAMQAQPRGAQSIQLLVACSAETVHKATQAAPDSRLFILPVDYKGRSCHRVCWGVYGSEAAAQEALRTVPRYFLDGGARPRVVPVSGLL